MIKFLCFCDWKSYWKNGFAEISKNLTRYGYENNFVGPSQ